RPSSSFDKSISFFRPSSSSKTPIDSNTSLLIQKFPPKGVSGENGHQESDESKFVKRSEVWNLIKPNHLFDLVHYFKNTS
ncbi:MAG: hypothetical protein Q8M92_00020, partial [Candidatus Subteraquimicrobiales bacterium]|nr:hypothetical protein [Candidatus Subteraquimicrobiales bacterium]